MAGSTISGGSTGRSSSGRKSTGKQTQANHANHPGTTNGNGANGSSGHAPGAGNGTSTYRVTIDVRKIQTNVYASEGGRLSELAVRNWLRSVGFHPEAGGRTWLADVESISRLDKSEIVRTERLHSSPVRAG
jgi:hypothetical protein